MKQIVTVVFVAAMVGAPVQAQGTNDMRDGMGLLQQGSRLLLQGLLKELGPLMLELEGKIIDLNAYEFPEILPNGDIIIRRKVPLKLAPPQDGETDL